MGRQNSCAGSDLVTETKVLARRLASGPTQAYARTKTLMNESASHTLKNS